MRHLRRPLRSLMLGDTDHYFSPYIFGVNQACGELGIWHSQVSLRWGAETVEKRVIEVQPDILWTHMALWPPRKGALQWELIDICRAAKKRGSRVILHDGDPKERTRSPYDLSDFITLALCNHKHDRSLWKVPTIFWPYAAFGQKGIAKPNPRFACDIAFAGRVVYPTAFEELPLGNQQLPPWCEWWNRMHRGQEPGAYEDRTSIILNLEAHHGLHTRVFNSANKINTLLMTPELSASALAVLGFGRPDPGGWIDTRVFQYPGAGAILLHDDVGGLLEPNVHYISHEGTSSSIIETVERLKRTPKAERMKIRLQAFDYVQKHHSWIARVRQVLKEISLCGS